MSETSGDSSSGNESIHSEMQSTYIISEHVQTTTGIIICLHNIPRKVEISREGRNIGRRYLRCGLNKGVNCGFKVWFDDALPTTYSDLLRTLREEMFYLQQKLQKHEEIGKVLAPKMALIKARLLKDAEFRVKVTKELGKLSTNNACFANDKHKLTAVNRGLCLTLTVCVAIIILQLARAGVVFGH